MRLWLMYLCILLAAAVVIASASFLTRERTPRDWCKDGDRKCAPIRPL